MPHLLLGGYRRHVSRCKQQLRPKGSQNACGKLFGGLGALTLCLALRTLFGWVGSLGGCCRLKRMSNAQPKIAGVLGMAMHKLAMDDLHHFRVTSTRMVGKE